MQKNRLQKPLLVLSGLTVVILAAMVWINQNDLPKTKEARLTLAPDFTAQGMEVSSKTIKTYKRSDFAGKWVVLEWFNNQCPFVEKHYGTGNMQQLQKTYTDQGVIWLSVASSKEGKQGFLNFERAKRVVNSRKSSQTAFIFDASGDIARSYGATATPHMFVIDPSGNIVYQGAIDDNSSFRKSTIEGAHNYVAQALDIGLGIDPKKRSNIEVAYTPAYGCGIKNDLTPETKP